uniref:Vomeronasal type-1 receptor n=1 Tax=Moschus moschiferus TaxID=68415 RepID=A0A8C6EEC9_MOSMO
MSFHKDALRNAGEAAVKAIFLLQMVAGALGNAVLFSRGISPVFLGHKQRPVQMVLPHLALADLLVLLSTGVPHTMAAFVSRRPLSSLGCKSVILEWVAISSSKGSSQPKDRTYDSCIGK